MTDKARLIVSLDVFSFDEMLCIVEATRNEVTIYKIGHQLFTAEGPRVIKYLKDLGKQVFLDLKLHEISNSVASAVRAAGRHGVDIITVHASGGVTMMQAAVDAATEFGAMKILALTVVTGLSDADLKAIGFSGNCEQQALKLAKLAEQAGCHGIVASAIETPKLRQALDIKMLIVTPGVRPQGVATDDQVRVATPESAIRAGASYVVVGRPIVQAENPAEVARAINQKIAKALVD